MIQDPDDERIKAALEDLNRLIIERVRREQRRDQLTSLPNDLALDEFLEQHIERGTDIWAAFIEVDKFKSINDRFGYQNADQLLKELGRLLKNLSKSFPGSPGAVQVFRPHGDEFFIVGTHEAPDPHRPDALSTLLDLACAKVRELSLPVVRVPNQDAEKLSCTVSIGWLVSSDVERPFTARALRDCLERAVDEAKRTRNCTVRYSAALRHRQSVSLRADCGSCRSKFTVDILIEANRADASLHCPNCGEAIARPPVPAEAPITPPVQV